MSQPLSAPAVPVRIQLCGRFAVVVDGVPREDALPGRQGQRLFAYLALYRQVALDRAQLVEAVWGADAPRAADGALSALLSKLRVAVGDLATGRGVPRVRLPPGSWFDVEHAVDQVHLAESRIAMGEPATAYLPAMAARYVCERQFLPGHEGDWVDSWRRRLDDIHTRSLAAWTEAALAVGGPELHAADRTSALLVEKCPFRESAHALRMDVLERLGNTAEALLAYEQLRERLAEELGTGPGPELRARHERLLRTT